MRTQTYCIACYGNLIYDAFFGSDSVICERCSNRYFPDGRLRHDLYETEDECPPQSILDANGDLVLALCRRCGQGEGELDEACTPPVVKPTASLLPPMPKAYNVAGSREVIAPTAPHDGKWHPAFDTPTNVLQVIAMLKAWGDPLCMTFSAAKAKRAAEILKQAVNSLPIDVASSLCNHRNCPNYKIRKCDG